MKARHLAVIGAIVVAIGTALPWANSIRGLEMDDGLVFLLLALLMALGALVRFRRVGSRAWLTVVFSLLALALGTAYLLDITADTNLRSNEYAEASPGIGLYAVIVGSMLGLIGLVPNPPTPASLRAAAKTCPQCGARVKPTATACRFCEYQFVEAAEPAQIPTALDEAPTAVLVVPVSAPEPGAPTTDVPTIEVVPEQPETVSVEGIPPTEVPSVAAPVLADAPQPDEAIAEVPVAEVAAAPAETLPIEGIPPAVVPGVAVPVLADALPPDEAIAEVPVAEIGPVEPETLAVEGIPLAEVPSVEVPVLADAPQPDEVIAEVPSVEESAIADDGLGDAVSAGVEVEETATETTIIPERDCPECGIRMTVRTATREEHAGKQFYVCPNFAACRQVLPVD